MKNKNINFNFESQYLTESEMMRLGNVTTTYSESINDLQIRTTEVNSFIDELRKEEFREYKIKISSSDKRIFVKNLEEKENIRFELNIQKYSEHSYVDLYTNDLDSLEKYLSLYSKFESTEVDKYVAVEQLVLEGNQLNTSLFEVGYEDLEEVKEDYYPYLKTDLLFEQFFISNENILILTGEPGVGKSKLVSLLFKFLLENFSKMSKYISNNFNEFQEDYKNINICYVKNEDILSLDKFWNTLSKGDNSIVFLDDADNCLLPRKSSKEITSQMEIERNKFINNLLSFTDGVYKNNIKFIITTNRAVDELDQAALRKGRTFDILKLRNLKKEEALKIWKTEGIDIEIFENTFGELDYISPAELGSELTLRKSEKNSGKKFEDYCLEEDISIYQNTRNKKITKIGFD